MKVQAVTCLLFIGLSNIAAALQHESAEEVRVRNCVDQGVENHARIITGTITDRRIVPGNPLLTNSSTASVTVRVDQYLRGPHLPYGSVTLPVDWTEGPTKPWNLRPPIWYVNTDPGQSLMLALMSTDDLGVSGGNANDLRAICVVDLDSVSAMLPTVKRMVRLDSSEGSAKIAAMEHALSDDSKAVRILAVNYLTSPNDRDSQTRRFVFQHFAPIALNAKNPQRGEAIQAITATYDAFTEDSQLNDEILSFIASRTADPDPVIRSNAIQWVYWKVGGAHPNPAKIARIRFTNRAEVLQQLRRDASGGIIYANGVHEKDAEKEAAQLLQAFEAQ